jgi:hypothetical protein
MQPSPMKRARSSTPSGEGMQQMSPLGTPVQEAAIAALSTQAERGPSGLASAAEGQIPAGVTGPVGLSGKQQIFASSSIAEAAKHFR